VHHVKKSILVPYTPAEVFDIVNDVERYPEFMPWCGGAKVLERHGDGITASITIAFGGLTQAFTTRNVNARPEHIVVDLVDGPFKTLRGDWQFRPLGEVACKVLFDLEYAFKSPTLEMVVGPVFGVIANTFIDSFARRVEAVYGERI
jgi:ribosome-associated toxin RatA of RatAB toxin-antitoxin module